MNKQEIIEAIKKEGNHYIEDNEILISNDVEVKNVENNMLGERRWGYSSERIYKINNEWYLCLNVYQLTGSSSGEDEIEDLYEVFPKEVTSIEWIKNG